MRVRDWREILEDVTESSADPEGWRAVGGRRDAGVGEDLYLGHPSVGMYHLKTYARNPFEVNGVGTKVARKVDGDLDPLLPDTDEEAGRFAVRTPPEGEDEAERMQRRLAETLRVHAEAPTGPEDLFRDLMEAVDSPAFGPMRFDLRDRPDPVEELSGTFEEAERLLDAELEDLVEADGIDRGFQ
ncbi:MAG: hypothetical protein ABEH78_00870 [Haloferacaceae archaeon]